MQRGAHYLMIQGHKQENKGQQAEGGGAWGPADFTGCNPTVPAAVSPPDSGMQEKPLCFKSSLSFQSLSGEGLPDKKLMNYCVSGLSLTKVPHAP